MELALLIIVYLILMFLGFRWLHKTATSFYKEADRIEKTIKSARNEDTIACKALKDDIFKDIKALSAKSFHRTTGDRVRELGKMFEVKFNVTIIR